MSASKVALYDDDEMARLPTNISNKGCRKQLLGDSNNTQSKNGGRMRKRVALKIELDDKEDGNNGTFAGIQGKKSICHYPPRTQGKSWCQGETSD